MHVWFESMPVFTNNTKIHHINVNQASFNIFQHSITLNTLQSFFLKNHNTSGIHTASYRCWQHLCDEGGAGLQRYILNIIGHNSSIDRKAFKLYMHWFQLLALVISQILNHSLSSNGDNQHWFSCWITKCHFIML